MSATALAQAPGAIVPRRTAPVARGYATRRPAGRTVERAADRVVEHAIEHPVERSAEHTVECTAENTVETTVETTVTPSLPEPQERMRALYEIHADALVRAFLHWTCGDRQAAEDLMQETMLRAWRNLDKLYTDPLALRPWLITVGRRIAIDTLRARSARPAETMGDSFERLISPEPYGRILDRSVIRELLAGLSADHRTVLLHVYVHDLTVPQTALVLRIPEGTVKSRLHNALRSLRAAMEPTRADDLK